MGLQSRQRAAPRPSQCTAAAAAASPRHVDLTAGCKPLKDAAISRSCCADALRLCAPGSGSAVQLLLDSYQMQKYGRDHILNMLFDCKTATGAQNRTRILWVLLCKHNIQSIKFSVECYADYTFVDMVLPYYISLYFLQSRSASSTQIYLMNLVVVFRLSMA